MKRLIWIAALYLVTPISAWTQGSTIDPVSSGSQQVPCYHNDLVASDPVTSRLRQVFDCYSDGMIAIADEIPANEYAPQRVLAMTVGHMVSHVAALNDFGCSKIAGAAPPGSPRIASESDKENLVAFLKSSVEFCKQAFSTLSDAKLGEPIPWDGVPPFAVGQTVTRIAAALEVTNDLIERYIVIDVYLQMRGLPTASTLATLDSVPLVEKGHPPLAIKPESSSRSATPLTPPSAGGSSLKKADPNRN